MIFVDQVKVHVFAGSGGKGCQSFYRDKYNRFGKPDGGDGGHGANIVIRAEKGLYTLLDFRYRSEFRAASGAHGSSKGKRGRDAKPLILRVPSGTLVRDAKNDCILRDLADDGAEVIVAKGGRGGVGNQGGRQARVGSLGEEKELILDLKVIADVGLVGFPNAGKSTLISAISSAHPKIAAYPFTTKSPILGVVQKGEFCFTVADIPGLIEGAHQGKGLGDRFLRHIERTKILLLVIDVSASEGRDPLEDYKQLNKELGFYSKEVLNKPQLIIANKLDLAGAEDKLKKFKNKIKKKVYPISALKADGLEDLIEAISKELQKSSN